MKRQELMTRLQSYLNQAEKPGELKDIDERSRWADNVAPLLKFDADYYKNFNSHSSPLKHKVLGQEGIALELRFCVGIVRQAIITLETNVQDDSKTTVATELPYPQKVTMAWLWLHVPALAWWTAGGVLVAAGGIGYTIGEWRGEAKANQTAKPTPTDAVTAPTTTNAGSKTPILDSAKKTP